MAGFKKYIKEHKDMKKVSKFSIQEKLKKAWSLVESLNHLNKIPPQNKTNMALEFERAIREAVQKKRQSNPD